MNHMMMFNATTTAVENVLEILRLHLPKGVDPKHLKSVYFLKKAFGCSRQDGLIIHHTCDRCLYLYTDQDINICPHCALPRFKANGQPTSFFLELDIASQIQELFNGK